MSDGEEFSFCNCQRDSLLMVPKSVMKESTSVHEGSEIVCRVELTHYVKEDFRLKAEELKFWFLVERVDCFCLERSRESIGKGRSIFHSVFVCHCEEGKEKGRRRIF